MGLPMNAIQRLMTPIQGVFDRPVGCLQGVTLILGVAPGSLAWADLRFARKHPFQHLGNSQGGGPF